MRRDLMILGVVMILAGFGNLARAGAVSDCRQPFLYESADVNVLILRFETTAMKGAASHEANQLAKLVELDTLFSNLGYRSIAVTALTEQGGAGCPSADEIMADLIGTTPGSGAVREGHGLVLLSGRIYQEGKELFVQTEMQFQRQGISEEIFGLPAGKGSQRRWLEGALPGSRVSFPPRRLTASDLTRIGAEYRKVANLRATPDAEQSTPIEVTPDQPFAYRVGKVEGEWFQVTTFDGKEGWIRAGAAHTTGFLHEKLPELEMLSGVVGYLSYRILEHRRAAGKRGPGSPAAAAKVKGLGDIAEQARHALSGFEGKVSGSSWNRSRAFALAMDGILGILSGPRPPRVEILTETRDSFQQAAKALPYNGELYNLVAMSMAHLCDIEGKGGECYEEVWTDFQQALAFAPMSERVVSNVQSYHQLLQDDAVAASEDWLEKTQKIDRVRKALEPPTNLRRTDVK